MGPLAGVKVLDLSRILAGPWATQCLADFGADVWKVEKPGAGDDTRQWGPPWLADRHGNDSTDSAYFLSANRAKRSLAIDIATTQGQELVRKLSLQADVLVENFKVGGLAKYQLDWPALQKVNPALIYCSISAFGQDGPDAAGAGYDAMIQGRGGLMSLTGNPPDSPGGGPQKVGVAVADLMTGMYAVAAITAALFERRGSALGQHIDLSLLDTQVAMLANQNLNYLMTGRVPQRLGTAHPNLVPYQAVPARDGAFMLAIGNDRQFADFCRIASRESTARDPRFASNAARVRNRIELIREIEIWCRERTQSQWLESLTQNNVPCGPINDLAAVFADPQVQHRQMRMDIEHAIGGTVAQVRNPILYSRTALEYETPPPLLGEHTADVLAAQAGVTAEEFDALRLRGVVA